MTTGGINEKLDAILRGQEEAVVGRDEAVREVKAAISSFDARITSLERWQSGGGHLQKGAEWRIATIEKAESGRKKLVGTVLLGSAAAVGASLWAAIVAGAQKLGQHHP